MRSSLSHNVCRQLLAYQGLSVPVTALSISSPVCLRLIRRPRPLFCHATRRTFLNKLFNNAPREFRKAGVEPGFGAFLDFQARSAEGVKLPDRSELIAAFILFFNQKITHKRPVNRTEAYHVRLVLEYLLNEEAGAPEEPRLVVNDFRNALCALTRPTRRQQGNEMVKLASILYQQIKNASVGTTELRSIPELEELGSISMEHYISVLTSHGATQEAAQLLANFSNLAKYFSLDKTSRFSDLHLKVLQAFVKDRNPAAKEYMEKLEAIGFKYLPEFHEALTTFYASLGKDSEEELRQCFEKPCVNEQMGRPGAYLALVKYSDTTGTQPKWLIKALQTLCDLNPPKAWWDVILQWAIYQGKDINQIKHMINVITEMNQKDKSVRADISTINGLIAAALDHKSMLLAERLYALASELGLRPNTQTKTLLLQARIAGNDSIGAASAFEEILHYSPLVPGSETEAVINQYLKYLCSGTTGVNGILNVLSRIEKQGGELDPDTVVAVCSNFLTNDRAEEVIDTLGLHLKQFSSEERHIVQASLQEYCLDKEVSTARAWKCYSLLRQFFPEMNRKERVQLMQGFFGRKRADMATQIFGHMRGHANEDARPDLEAYVRCFEGLGAYPDEEESLKLVHNMLKTDTKIQPNTRLYNALMLAYTADERPKKAFTFFQKITNSTEGPSYASLEIVFRACQIMPDGYEKAKSIWDKMKRLEIEVPIEVFDAYVLMMAGQGRLDDLKSLLVTRQAEYVSSITPVFLGSIYNAFEFPPQQKEFEKWASFEFPKSWQTLNNRRRFQTQNGGDRFGILPKTLRA